MNWVKDFALVTCLATPLSVIVATSASAEDTKPAMTTSDSATKKPMMSEADRRAKATECSKQADAKGLHGEARKKFRSECKRK